MSWNVCCQLVTKLYQHPESSQQIAKYLLYHHASPAVLHNSGMFYLREVSKGKGLSLAPIIEGECVSAWDHPSGPLPPSDVFTNLFGTKDRKFWHFSQSHNESHHQGWVPRQQKEGVEA